MKQFCLFLLCCCAAGQTVIVDGASFKVSRTEAKCAGDLHSACSDRRVKAEYIAVRREGGKLVWGWLCDETEGCWSEGDRELVERALKLRGEK